MNTNFPGASLLHSCELVPIRGQKRDRPSTGNSCESRYVVISSHSRIFAAIRVENPNPAAKAAATFKQRPDAPKWIRL